MSFININTDLSRLNSNLEKLIESVNRIAEALDRAIPIPDEPGEILESDDIYSKQDDKTPLADWERYAPRY